MSAKNSALPSANEIKELKLKEDCWLALAEIGVVLESARLLKLVMTMAPIARVLFNGSSRTPLTIKVKDWQQLAEAVQSIDRLAATRCRDLATTQYAMHSRERHLRDFWENVVNIFQRRLAVR